MYSLWSGRACLGRCRGCGHEWVFVKLVLNPLVIPKTKAFTPSIPKYLAFNFFNIFLTTHFIQNIFKILKKSGIIIKM
jgi:hypothetical protein